MEDDPCLYSFVLWFGCFDFLASTARPGSYGRFDKLGDREIGFPGRGSRFDVRQV